MLNKVILIGNLTRHIELRYSNSSMAIAKTAIATNHKFTSNGENKEEVCFIDITFFGRSAEVANQYLRKGSKILVEGRLIFEQWVDQNGQKRSKHSVFVEKMKMLNSRSDNHVQQPASNQPSYEQPAPEQQQPSYEQPAPQQQQASYPSQAKEQSRKMQTSSDMHLIDEDEIPF